MTCDGWTDVLEIQHLDRHPDIAALVSRREKRQRHRQPLDSSFAGGA